MCATYQWINRVICLKGYVYILAAIGILKYKSFKYDDYAVIIVGLIQPGSVDFDYSRSYDACIQNITGAKYVNEQVCPGAVPKFLPAQGKKKKGKKPPPPSKSFIPRCDPDGIDPKFLPCETDKCPELPKTTPEYLGTPGNRIIKRTLHGGINIVTNFCIMPICVFIARFYKETFNLASFKGQRIWYWVCIVQKCFVLIIGSQAGRINRMNLFCFQMHMVGAGGSTLLMYMGYFTDKLVDESDAHLVNGNLYIICLGLSYVTAWIRHKNRWISMIVESIHSCCGYACFILARKYFLKVQYKIDSSSRFVYYDGIDIY